jgi:betaine-aldehyde dehydrogenase
MSVLIWASSVDTKESQKYFSEKSSFASNAKAHLDLALLNNVSNVEDIAQKLKQFTTTLPFEQLVVSFDGGVKQDQSSVFYEVSKQDDGNKLYQLRTDLSRHLGVQEQNGPIRLNIYHGPNASAVCASLSAAKGSVPKYEVDGFDVVSLSTMTLLGRAQFKSGYFLRSGLYINGEWVNPATSRYMPVVNPANKQVFHTVAAAGMDDVNRAVQAASEAFESWSQTTAQQRADYLNAIAAELEARQEEISKLEVLDNGKPYKEAALDIADVIGCFRYYATQILLFEKEKQDQTIEIEGQNSVACYVRYEPVGVAGLIIPWNYPLLMAAWKVAPCLAAGSSCVLKPSELTPVTALELAAAAHKVKLPKGVLNVLTGFGPDAGAPLSNHPDVAKLAFTGSVATGSKIMEAGSKTVKKVTLELGGKSPILVFDDADVDQAVEWIMVGIFFNQGQVCSATSRLLVQEGIKDKLIARLVEEAKKIKLGSGFDEEAKMGPIVSEGQYHRVLSYIKRGQDEGAKLLCGGQPTDPKLRQGFFIEPVVFDNVQSNMTVWREEIFGPVLAVMSFKTEQEGLKLANDSTYGLAGAVISKDQDRCKRVVRGLRCGIVWVNCSQPTLVQAPWGGMKQSGSGRELGPWGLMNYLEPKQVTSWVDPQEKGWNWYLKSSL